jgi:hypothetical protein
VVTDSRGLMAAAMATARVTNVAPSVTALAGATLLPGETYTGAGSFTDPGADQWSAVVDYGDGSAVQPLTLVNGSFSLSHRYTTAGAHTVTVTVTDDDVSSMRMATVVVLTPQKAVENALALVAGLGSDVSWRSVEAKLQEAGASLQRGDRSAASGQLGAVREQVAAIVRSGRSTAAAVEPLDSLVRRLIESIS